MKKLTLFFLIMMAGVNLLAQQSGEPAAKWNFNGRHFEQNPNPQNSSECVDWVFDILPTDKYEYIVCGYSSSDNPGTALTPPFLNLIIWAGYCGIKP